LPKRFTVRYGPNPTDFGLLVNTPGSAAGKMVESKPDCSAGDLEAAISQVLLNTVNLADGIAVTLDDDRVLVEVVNPQLESKRMWIYESLGTPIASLVASVAAQLLDKPVLIQTESPSKGKILIELKVVGRASEN